MPVVLEIILPVLLIIREIPACFGSVARVPIYIFCFCFIVLMEARIRLSDRFLFLRCSKMSLASSGSRVVLDIFNSCQFLTLISFIGGFEGL